MSVLGVSGLWVWVSGSVWVGFVSYFRVTYIALYSTVQTTYVQTLPQQPSSKSQLLGYWKLWLKKKNESKMKITRVSLELTTNWQLGIILHQSSTMVGQILCAIQCYCYHS